MNDILSYMTENRKLKLEEYDDDGKLVDTREFSNQDMFFFIVEQMSSGKLTSVARIEDLNMFTKEELELVEMIVLVDKELHWTTKYKVHFIRKLLDETDTQLLKCALNLMEPILWGEHIFNNEESDKYDFTLQEMISFIKSRDGVYYTIDNQGRRKYDFIDKPTKQQISYYRDNYCNRSVFLSFKDWKEHLIN